MTHLALGSPDSPSSIRRLPVSPVLQGLALVGLGLFLYSRLANGTLWFYIHQRFGGLTLAAALGLMIVGATYAARRHGVGAHGDGIECDAAHDDDNLDHAHDHGGSHHHHTHAHTHVTWAGLGLICLPAVLGLLVPPQPLGAAAMAGRELNIAGLSGGAVRSQRQLLGPAGDRNILDWLLELQASGDARSLDGRTAKVVGFVYRPGGDGAAIDGMGADTFVVGRFVLSCCAADATPASLMVRWPDAAALQADAWVQVSGAFEAAEVEGRLIPVLVADTVNIVEAPSQPYLYP